jgi:3',5'-cyclic-AMP phosphodiesterase
MKHVIRWLAFGVLLASCLRPTEERVAQDLAVGHAEQGDVAVHVDDGLAAVRSLSPSELILWGSAPGYVIAIELPAGRELEIETQNCLRDAELRLLEGDAELSALDATTVPTRKRWRLRTKSEKVRLGLSAPDAEAREPFRFALMSDVQEAIDEVQDIYRRINEVDDVRFLLGAGDLTQRGRREELERFQRELLSLRVPYFTTLGNHELGQGPTLYQEYFGRGSFQFRFHGVAFTLLDDASASLDPDVYDWLEDWLESARSDVHIVAMHIPPIDPIGVRNGSWASRSEASKLLARLAEGRVDLTLYGHVHSYYSFDNAGIPAFISGGGGAIPERFDRIGRHFMVFRVGPERGIVGRNLIKVD